MVTVELPSPPQAEVTRNGDLWPCRWPKHRQHAGHGDAPPDGPSVQTGRVEGGDSRAICRDLPGQGGGVLGQPDRACRRHMARWRDERAAPRTVKAALTVLAAVALWRHVVPVPGAALLARSAEQQRSSPMASLILSPQRYDAVIFDLDGVVTDTASVHAAAWRRLFDDYLAARPSRVGENHLPFTDEDYRRFVDGRARYDGVVDFLASRGIAEDPSAVRALGDRKDGYFHESVAREGVRV